MNLSGKIPDIRALRTAIEISQEELANQLGVTTGTVRRWEKGYMPSRMARNFLVAWLRLDPVIRKLVATMEPDALLAALGDLAEPVLAP